MSNEILFYTQIGSALAFILVLFTLYSSLSSQKDARIELLEEKIKMLGEELEKAKAAGPDVLAKSLSERVTILEAELHRRRAESSTNAERIAETEKELGSVRAEVKEFQRQLERAEELVGDLFCPYCRSPIDHRDVGSGSISSEYGDYDVDWEDTYYECGLHLNDGKEIVPCGRKAG